MATRFQLRVRSGDGEVEIIPLAADDRVTIGRSSSNRVVLNDNRCSREHALVFCESGKWYVRDLGSRNGTAVGRRLVTTDVALAAGDGIRIGQSILTLDPVPDAEETRTNVPGQGEGVGECDGSSPSADGWDSAEIRGRRGTTRFLLADEPVGESSEGEATPEADRNAARLCRLAFDIGKAESASEVAELCLAGLLSAIRVDAGGVLWRSESRGRWTVLASKSPKGRKYARLPAELAASVAAKHEALHCSTTGMAGQGDIPPERSMICAPLRADDRELGVIHLYSTSADVEHDDDDLEYVLAVADTVAVALENLNRRNALAESLTKIRTENVRLRRELESTKQIIGGSPAMAGVHDLIDRAASSKATLLVRGESGVGKELVARAVHRSSARNGGPFVCLNCAALAEDLLASELFGHERGAFTGATDRKIGKFEAAHEGTLVLDEIGEMSPAIQAKFLRVLEGHPFERVGGNEPVEVDVRVIAATNRDLEDEVTAGRFRRDLFFRLRVLEIIVPPLRKRGDDVIELAEFFLKRLKEETGRRIIGFDGEAIRLLREYHWPGNVRELKNVIERAVLLSNGPQIRATDLLLTDLGPVGDTGNRQVVGGPFEPMSLTEVEHRHIAATLEHTGWNKSRAATILGIERSTLDRKIRRYKIERPTDG